MKNESEDLNRATEAGQGIFKRRPGSYVLAGCIIELLTELTKREPDVQAVVDTWMDDLNELRSRGR